MLAATHFHEIFENGFLTPRVELAFGYMEVRVDIEAQEVEHQVTYLYKYDILTLAYLEVTLTITPVFVPGEASKVTALRMYAHGFQGHYIEV